MHIVLLIVLLGALLVGPGFWVQRVMARYRQNEHYRDRGSGGELARHLLNRLGLEEVKVELTDRGDHYDPEARAVRLTNDNYTGYSLTAITVAAHEVGHAIQHRDGELLFQWRYRLAKLAGSAEKAGAVMMLLMPLAVVLTQAPHAGLLFVVAGLGSIGLGALVHLVTLPVEWDASFAKALPILEQGGYLKQDDRPGARHILKAAAFTYVAGSLFSLLNVWRWLRVLRP